MLRIFSFVLFVLFGFSAFAADMSEQDKITALLNAFDTPGITFVRNGEDHDGAWAKKHLQDKLKEANPPVTTAKDFIVKIASTSSESGKPYLIKTQDGRPMPSGLWLRKKLAEIEHPIAAPAPAAAQ